MEKETQWIITTLGLIFLFLLPVVVFNYYIDPMWTFDHSNNYNNDQMPFDERQQKTNQLYFTSPHFDNLLIGSSRVSYIDATKFSRSTYNYGLSNIQLPEYSKYISYACNKTGPFNTIYLGLDFYGTNASIAQNPRSPEEVIGETEGFMYREKLLFSKDVLMYSKKNYDAALEKQYPINFAYSRRNVKRLSRVSIEATTQMEKEGIEKYRADLYSNYVSHDLNCLFKEILDSSPESQFVAFTTPVHKDFFSLIIEMNLYDAYESWLREIVNVFGKVYHFMYINEVTENLENFYDGSHLYPEVANQMISFLEDYNNSNSYFGILITPDNIDEILYNLRASL